MGEGSGRQHVGRAPGREVSGDAGAMQGKRPTPPSGRRDATYRQKGAGLRANERQPLARGSRNSWLRPGSGALVTLRGESIGTLTRNGGW